MKKDFTFEKFSSHSTVHSKLIFFFRAENKRKTLSPAHERKRERVASRHLSCCTYLMLVRLLINMKDLYLSRLA